MDQENKDFNNQPSNGEEEKVRQTVEGQAWYKKWYIWAIILLAILLLLAIVRGGHSNENPSETSPQVASQESQESQKTKASQKSKKSPKISEPEEGNFIEDSQTINKANEEVVLKTEAGDKASLTIQSARDNREILPSDLYNNEYYAGRTIVIDYSYKNDDLPKNFVVKPSDFVVYDEEGYILECIDRESDAAEVAPGKSANSQGYYKFNDVDIRPKKLKIDYVPKYTTPLAPIASIEVDVEQ
ncbi:MULTISPECIES: hypothetical protein [Aerococcus]|uniref:hypothetical protein n=1 Tax=Aerococcus TaxID=1375 RepID=UPI000DCC7C7E|nr:MULTISPECIES: hypothetical protein [Aerococcus]KAA9264211.1 hypothetical protein F6I19_07955 [Aerococcus loyolae]MCY3084073.1 hypothetical protein [Aerococcus mictus]MDK6231524.1 hypothetical protein [Aerococcus urinae]MDK6257522.1 hypothetical protein [Aerococcus urinae]MDK6293875.1 hypothetical protein [Aerococcus urinae]